MIEKFSIFKYIQNFSEKFFIFLKMGERDFIFILNDHEHLIPRNFLRCGEITPDIYKKLIKNNKYEIKSSVDEEIFDAFIKYLTSAQVPEINEFNKLGFLQLSREFNVMKNLIISVEDEINECLDDIKILGDPSVPDKSLIEEKISQNIDHYLDLCGEKLLESPLNSIYNIFSKGSTKLTKNNLCYQLIKKHYENHNDLKIFILLQFLNGSKLSQENLKDAIDSRQSRLDYIPQIEFSFISDLIEEQRRLNTENNKLKLENQIQDQKIDKLKNILFGFIVKSYNEYNSKELKHRILIPIVEKEKWNNTSPKECSLTIDDQIITITSSSSFENKEDHAVINLFNGLKESENQTGLRWASDFINSAEIIINVKKPITANVLLMSPRYSECISQAPRNFSVCAGNDLQNIKAIREFKNINWTTDDERRFLFDNTNEYTYYKLVFTNTSSQHFGLSELNLGELTL